MYRITLLSLLLLPTTVAAQQQVSPNSKNKPTALLAPHMSLANVKLVSLSEDNNSVIIVIPKSKSETKTRQATVTKFDQVKRIRTIQVNGMNVDQEYTVQVPYTQTVDQEYTVETLDTSTSIEVPLKNVRTWKIDGSRLSAEQFRSACSKPTHMIVAEVVENEPFEKLNPFFASVLRPDTIVLFYTTEADQKPPAR